MLRELDAIHETSKHLSMNGLMNQIIKLGINAYLESKPDSDLNNRIQLIRAQQPALDEETAEAEENAD